MLHILLIVVVILAAIGSLDTFILWRMLRYNYEKEWLEEGGKE